MKLICPFTFNVNRYNILRSRLERIKVLLAKFYETNKIFHEIELVTDEQSHKLLSFVEFDNVRYVETESFNFVDDFKIHLLQTLKQDEIIIDYDIFLKKPLTVSNNYDLIIERYEEDFAEKIYKDLISKSEITFNKQYFLNIENLNNVPNIGVLRINNDNLLKEYTALYTAMSVEFKNNATAQGYAYNQYSVLFGQLLLRKILNDSRYSTFCAKEFSKNNYIHLNGENKFNFSLKHIEKMTTAASLI